MSTNTDPTNILGKIGKKVGTEIKEINTALGTKASSDDLNTHTGNSSNPHSVNKTQVGLGNVENVALSSWAGSSKITKLGAVDTGTIPYSLITNAPNPASSTGVTGDFTIGGSLTVNGSTSTLQTQTVEVEDNMLELNKSSDASVTAQVSGISINRGQSTGSAGSSAVGTLNVSIPSYYSIPVTLVFEQIDATHNDQPVYSNKRHSAEIPADTYRIRFEFDLTTATDGYAGGTTLTGWHVVKDDGTGNYTDFTFVALSGGAPVVDTYSLTVEEYNSDPNGNGSHSGIGAFKFSGGDGLNVGGDWNPLPSTFSQTLTAGDKINIMNNSGQTIRIYSPDQSTGGGPASSIGNGQSEQFTFSDQGTYYYTDASGSTGIASVSGSSYIGKIEVAEAEVETEPDPAFLYASDMISAVDLPQKLEEWHNANINSTPIPETVFNNDGDPSDPFSYQIDSPDAYVQKVNSATDLVTQDTPFSAAVASAPLDKAKIIWDNNNGAEKFKLLVGEAKADLAMDDLDAQSVTVPSGSNLTVGAAPLGDYSEFESALATAKAG